MATIDKNGFVKIPYRDGTLWLNFHEIKYYSILHASDGGDLTIVFRQGDSLCLEGSELTPDIKAFFRSHG